MMLRWRMPPWRKSLLLPPPQLKPQGPAVMPPPTDVAHLQEEANKALGDLLMVKFSIDAHQQKLVSEFSMALCENDSETMESYQGGQSHQHPFYPGSRELVLWPSGRQRPEGSPRPLPFNSHTTKLFSTFEEESIEEERKSQLNFLSICQAALQASPPEFHGMLVASYHILLGHAPTSHLFSIPQGAPPFPPGLAPRTSSSPALEHSPRPKRQHHSPDPMDTLPLSRATSQATPEEPST